MRRLCKVITTDNERKIPVAATHSTAAWTAENAAYTESNPTFAQKTIDAYKLTDLVKVSIELLDDSALIWRSTSPVSLPMPSVLPRSRHFASAPARISPPVCSLQTAARSA